MKNKRQFTQEQEKQLSDSYIAGKSITQIQNETRISKPLIREILLRNKVVLRDLQQATAVGVKKNRAITKENVLGQQFGLVTVTECLEEPDGIKNNGGLWMCKCHCGGEMKKTGYELRAQKNSTNNGCGCGYKRKAALIIQDKNLPVEDDFETEEAVTFEIPVIPADRNFDHVFESVKTWLSELNIKYEQSGDTFIFNERKLAFKIDCSLYPIFNRDAPKILKQESSKFNASEIVFIFFRVEDWIQRPSNIKHWLIHRLGLSNKICFARECESRVVQSIDASNFYDKYHLQGRTRGVNYGLYFDNNLVACMTFSKSSQSRTGSTDIDSFSLTRFAVAGNIPGAASKLFAYSITCLRPRQIETFSDDSYATGGIYEKLGFTMEKIVEPDYRVWHPKTGIKHKSCWSRRQIPARLREIEYPDTFEPETDPRTEAELEEMVGCFRIWDCGKKKWTWTDNTRFPRFRMYSPDSNGNEQFLIVTPDVMKVMIEMYHSGKTGTDIAKHYDIIETSLYRLFKENGLDVSIYKERSQSIGSEKHRKYDSLTIYRAYLCHVSNCNGKIKRRPLGEDVWKSIVFKPCTYCGKTDIRLSISNKNKSNLTDEQIEKYTVRMNGIDRVDSSKGYVDGNMVPCCSTCNWMKSNLLVGEFLAHIKSIHEHSNINKNPDSIE